MLGACAPPKATFKGTDVTGIDWGGDVTLQAHTGNRVSTADFRGKLVILFFGYTHCPDICAPTLAKLAALRKALGLEAPSVQIIFITVDPAHDTPKQLASFLAPFDAAVVGLTGTPEEVAAAAREYKVAPALATGQQGSIAHSGTVFVKDSAGKLRLLWRNEMPAMDMEYDVRLLLKAEPKRRT